MDIARTIGRRSTCPRRQVGAVLVDALGRVLSVGHNGVARGERHCTDEPCGGAGMASGVGLDQCNACHGEANSLIFCPDVERIDTLYVTVSPCTHCIRLLLNTSCRRIVYAEPYDPAALARWLASAPWRTAMLLEEGAR